MKVLIRPRFEGPDRADGGIRRWVDAQQRLLPVHGFEMVTREEEADLVVCHAGDLVNTGKPLVAHCHGVYNTADQQWDKWAWMLNAHVIEVLRRAQLVTVPSRWVAMQLARGMNLKAHVLYAGMDPVQWGPGENQGYVLWNKTRVDPICDPAPLAKLAAVNPALSFVTTFGQPAPNVTVTGTVPYEQSREMVRRAGIYLSTTKETFGIGTVEAMACGVPVLGWAWGGNLDIVLHGATGYLASPGDYEDLQRGLEVILERRAEMGEAAREHVLAHFTWDRAIAEVAGLYRDVLHGWETNASPRVSVVVTCYELEQYLPECLDSLIAQTYVDWDCWVVDDASPGKCKEIVENYRNRDKRFHYIRTPRNLYLAGARNHGIGQSWGRYVLPLDADDMLNPRSLEVLAGHLDKHPGHAIAYGAMEVLEPDGRRWVSGWPPQFKYSDQITHRNQLPYASMYRREVWARTGGYRTRCQTAEDADFWCRVTSFGFRPYRATDYACLVKRERAESMGHVEADPDWTAWYPWSRHKALVPWGCAGDPPGGLSWPVQLYDPPKISIVIPVGPGHEDMVKDALDSVQAQTMPAWECIIANDSGRPLELAGWPWARVVDTPAPGSGPAVARNMAIAVARAPLIACLDGDDYYMPGFLERTMALAEEYGGYVYTDWFEVGRDGHAILKEAPEFKPLDLLERGLTFTVNSLFPRKAWEAVGGFDPACKSWEDWDFFFALATKGICGTRVPEPLFVYRYWSGQRREDGYAQADDNARALRRKWGEYTKDGGAKLMAGCRSCGGGGGGKAGTGPVTHQMVAQEQKIAQAQTSGMVRLEFIGDSIGDRYFKGQVSGQQYKFGNNAFHRRAFVWAVDAPPLLARRDFKLVEDMAPAPQAPPPLEAPLPVRQESRVGEPTQTGAPTIQEARTGQDSPDTAVQGSAAGLSPCSGPQKGCERAGREIHQAQG